MDANIKKIILETVNAFETGKAEGDYALVKVYRDGKGGTRQITYGRSQTTEQGKLKDLLMLYIYNEGLFSKDLLPYLEIIGKKPLCEDKLFKNILRKAAICDIKMKDTQDEFFDKYYFQPAMKWAVENGFTLPLSMLVIYDSFVHSGSILWKIRKEFDEVPPVQGGDEKVWIESYVKERIKFLSNHIRPEVRRSVYRARTLLIEVKCDNWYLKNTLIANGVVIVDENKQIG